MQTQVKRNELLKMQSWQMKRSEMTAKTDWRGRPAKGVLWNSWISLQDRKIDTGAMMKWNGLKMNNPTLSYSTCSAVPICRMVGRWGEFGDLMTEYSDTYSSAPLTQSGKLRPALSTLHFKQHFFISLPSHLGRKIILDMWLMALRNV